MRNYHLDHDWILPVMQQWTIEPLFIIILYWEGITFCCLFQLRDNFIKLRRVFLGPIVWSPNFLQFGARNVGMRGKFHANSIGFLLKRRAKNESYYLWHPIIINLHRTSKFCVVFCGQPWRQFALVTSTVLFSFSWSPSMIKVIVISPRCVDSGAATCRRMIWDKLEVPLRHFYHEFNTLVNFCANKFLFV